MLLSTSTNICAFLPGRERLPVQFSIDECAKAGYQVLDINFCMAMNPHSEMRGNDWEAYVRQIGQYAADRNIHFTQSHLPYYDVGQGTDPLMEELIRRSIIGSGMLGVKWCVTHPFTLPNASPDAQCAANLSYYAKHLQTIKAAGVGLALENDFEPRSKDHLSYTYCARIPELCSLVDAFADPQHVGACYDFGHANLMGGAHRENLHLLGNRIKALHVADNRGKGDDHVLPFFGNIDWKLCMTALKEIGYAGELTYEVQEHGRYLPQKLKHMVVEQSIEIGHYLLSLFAQASTNE